MPDPAIKSDPQEIPDKLYFRIGEVSRLAGIKPYVLRYWETEFPALVPKKSGTGHRLFRRKDVEMVLEIKRLLYDKRFTIEGARKFLEAQGKPPAPEKKKKPTARPQPVQGSLIPLGLPEEWEDIRKELRKILKLLD
jgi:DNA-binding transcriptional MerR regulator